MIVCGCVQASALAGSMASAGQGKQRARSTRGGRVSASATDAHKWGQLKVGSLVSGKDHNLNHLPNA